MKFKSNRPNPFFNNGLLFLTLLLSILMSACDNLVEDHFAESAPEQLIIVQKNTAKNSVQLSIPKVSGVQHYTVYWSKQQDLTNVQQIRLDKTQNSVDVIQLIESKTNEVIPPGDKVFISVSASWENKEGNKSNVLEFVAQPDPLETEDINPQTSFSKSVIAWEDSGSDDGTETYTIYWSTDPDVGVENFEGVAENITDNSFTHDQSTYENDQKIYYVITRVQHGVESPASDPVEVVVVSDNQSNESPSTVTLSEPTNVQLSKQGEQVLIAWSEVNNADSYTIYRDIINTFDIQTVVSFTSSTNSLSDDTVVSNQEYYYWVRARSDDSTSDLSAVAGPISVVKASPGVENLAPAFTINDSYTVDENQTAIVSLTASDPENESLIFELLEGSSAGLVLSGADLRFTTPINFEAKTADELVFNANLRVSDGKNNVDKTISIQVVDVNESPVINTDSSQTITENNVFVINVLATDPEGQSLSYSLGNNLDSSLFSIGSSSGELKFIAAPDFETPGDGDNNNHYLVEIIVSDSEGETTQSSFDIAVVSFDEPPSFTIGNSYLVKENTRLITTLQASDPENSALSYSIKAQAGDAIIIENNDQLVFRNAPDFESAISQSVNNSYQITLSVSDNVNSADITVNIDVTDVNEQPEFTTASDGLSITENESLVGIIDASDPEGNALLFAKAGGIDSGLFTIDQSSGELRFITPPNFENPSDNGGDNTYLIDISVSDSTSTVLRSFSIIVNDSNESPEIVLSDPISIEENTRLVVVLNASDPENDSLNYAIDGDQAALFGIENNNQLVFKTAPDFDSVASKSINNRYQINLSIGDGTNLTNKTINIQVTDINESPSINTVSPLAISEPNTIVRTLDVTDPENNVVTLSVTGGEDQSLFTIDSGSRELRFINPTQYVVNGDNEYFVEVSGSDGNSTHSVLFTVNVTNFNEAPTFTINNTYTLAENNRLVTTLSASDPDEDALTFDLTTNSKDFFAIENSDQLVFKTAPDFESATGKLKNNQYAFEAIVSDGSNTVNKIVNVAVTDVDEAPIISGLSIPQPYQIQENQFSVAQLQANDPENLLLSYAINTSPLSADANLFQVDTNGLITLKQTLDLETPTDSDTDGTYLLIVDVTDPANNLTSSDVFEFTVSGVNEAPFFTSPQVIDPYPENSNSIIQITAEDPENIVLLYAMLNGKDSNKFNFNAINQQLTFNTIPDYENPIDDGPNNQYEVDIQISDGINTVTQNLKINIENLNDSVPVFNTPSTFPAIEENLIQIGSVDVTDADGDLTPLNFLPIVGSDAGLINFDANSKFLTFKNAPDFEIPLDSNFDNVYEFTLKVNDGQTTVSQDFSIAISNLLNGLPAPVLTVVPLAGRVGETGKVIVKWPQVSGDSGGYRVYYAEEAGVTPENFRSLLGGTRYSTTINFNQTPFTLDGLELNKQFHFVVTTDNGVEESVQSGEKVAKPYIPELPLNDTGVVTCATDVADNFDCGLPEINPFFPQDGQQGRDADSGGFNFTKIKSNGNVTTVDDPTWSCVKDNTTGLIWEVKTLSGLQSSSNTYTWYNIDNTVNGGEPGIENGGSCAESGCDTQSYVAAVNTVGLCGASDWRMPTVDELQSLVDYSKANVGGLISSTYFPNNNSNYDLQNKSGFYWTGMSAVSATLNGNETAFTVSFIPGSIFTAFPGDVSKPSKNTAHYIRLVRKAQ